MEGEGEKVVAVAWLGFREKISLTSFLLSFQACWLGLVYVFPLYIFPIHPTEKHSISVEHAFALPFHGGNKKVVSPQKSYVLFRSW